MAGDITQSTLNLTPEEKRAYGQLFSQADTESLGVVTGDIAVKFFERTKLDSAVLAEIWQIADLENRGLLTPAGFSVALRLIGHCQAGREPSTELAKQPGPLPRFDSAAGPGQAPASAPSPSPITPQTSGPIRVPPLTPDKVNEYSSLFDKAGARNGFLSGDAAKQVFERARLPNEALGRIWNLADIEQRGALNSTEFVIAMHLIASMKTGTLRAVPYSLPPGLYEAASRRLPPPAPPSRQYTGQLSQRPESPLTRAALPPQTLSPDVTGNAWLVNPQDKVKFDQIFASIDKSGAGHINGEQAVKFFSTSGLSEDILASIWDLADINSEGQLNRDEFAVAMYLIRQQRGKREDRGDLPSVLPANLVPPMMRQQILPPSQTTAPAFDNAAFAPQQPKSAADDLFGLDAMTANDTGSQQAPGSPAPPQRSATLPQPTGSPQQSTTFKPFIPTSSFGQELAGKDKPFASSPRSLPSGIAPPPQLGSTNDDLLGDGNEEESRKLTSETTELGNMSNQIGQLRTQMQGIQGKKSAAEAEIGTTSNQKRELEARLAQFRTQYEQQINEVKQLEERLTASRADTRKVQQELAMIEGAHQDLQTQHQQVSTALEADQKENASLKERLQQLNTEVSQLRPQLDKMRSDARQQRNMVSVNQRQVATTESERDNLQSEMNDLGSAASQERSVAVAPEAEATGSAVASPAPSTTSQSTNPFFRRSPEAAAGGTMSPSIFAQDFGASQDRSVFDNIFRPVDSAGPTSTPPPTTFRSATPPSHTSTPPPASTPSISTLEASPAVEPPAPPESRQITSSALPLRPSGLRTESVSSSVKANPPASRAGEPVGGTPARSVSTPGESVNGDIGDSQVPTSPGIAQNREITSEPASANQMDSFAHSNEDESGAIEESIPGAFPDDISNSASTSGSTPLEPPASEGSRDITSIPSINNDTEASTTVTSDPSLFFNSASTSRAAPEFPAIQEIQQDSDSSSDSESGFGDEFDDNNANVATEPPATREITSDAPVEASLPPTSLTLPETNASEIGKDTSELPTPTAQTSPPAYEQTVSSVNESRESNQFPPEFGGLLPSREITNSPPVEVPQFSNINSPPASGEPSMSNGPTIAPSTDDLDDFDSAFADLSEAKEADEAETHDSFALDSSHVDAYEFNPTFESPAPPRPALGSELSPTPQSLSPARPVPDPPKPAESFADFQPNLASSTTPFGSSSAAPTTSAPESGSHDWDEIFAGLDSNTSTSTAEDPFAIRQPSVPGASSTLPEPAPKPPLARAASMGEHDDPILKTLTGMGYAREASVRALEKYDYNLDMAADYLASKS